MKTLLAVLIAALGLSAATADLLKVNLAAPLFVSGVELPAGPCTVQQMSIAGDNVVLLVRAETGQQATVLTNRITGTRDTKTGVVLNVQNGRYSLDQVWINELDGFQVLRPAGE